MDSFMMINQTMQDCGATPSNFVFGINLRGMFDPERENRRSPSIIPKDNIYNETMSMRLICQYNSFETMIEGCFVRQAQTQS